MMKRFIIGVLIALMTVLIGCTDTITSPSEITETNATVTSVKDTTPMKAMIIIGNKFGNTYFDMLDDLQGLGFEVVTVGVGDRTLMSSCPNHENIEVEVDMNIEQIDEENIEEYSAILIPAGSHFRTIRYSIEVGRVLNLGKENSLYIISVCSGIFVLANFDGLIEDVEIATSSLTREAILNAGGIINYSKVVVDGNFITGSTGNGSSDNAPIQELVEALYTSINNHHSTIM
ncbi:MAG: DJ-1/PfpI family protein [Bacilli bacterium]|nr:DJ-1/PfpI family protein [Bacilli bacterium]MBN2876150.1 DJ-1/PfpI family protein [Bacilli bacterium]